MTYISGQTVEEDCERQAVVQLRAERHQDDRLVPRPRHRARIDENVFREYSQSL